MRKFLFIFLLFISSLCYGFTEHGKATYYSKACTSLTASGVRMSPYKMACAHKTLPFGTKLKVTDKKTGKFVIVEIIDRGPYGRGGVVDLSWEAARQLDMLRKGVIDVVIEKVEETE